MYKVLVADDEPIERTVITKIIEKNFADVLEVVQAANGNEAVEKYTSEGCSIALLDIEMPGMNGLDAASIIREKHKGAGLIFITAFDEFSYAKKAVSVHAIEYLLKPADVKELTLALEEAIRLADEYVDHPDAEDGMSNAETPEETTMGRIAQVTETIRKYLDENYKNDISLLDVAEEMGYSEAYFCKIFKQCFDKSFIMYLSEYRVNKAKELLASGAVSVKDISSEVGYHDSNYFTKVFKRVEGVTPTEYKNSISKN